MVQLRIYIRVSHNTPFFELSLVLLTTHAIGSPMVANGFQGPRGTPGMGEMSYNQIDHILVIFLHDIQNRAISPLKSLCKTKMACNLSFLGL